MPIEQIAARLDDCFGLLAAGGRTAVPRHRTLHATMEWSHGLLSEEKQALFRRLSVFAGGSRWTESVCAGNALERGGVLGLLSQLVDKSLVVARERDGEARYRLLETVRQYGQEKLSDPHPHQEERTPMSTIPAPPISRRWPPEATSRTLEATVADRYVHPTGRQCGRSWPGVLGDSSSNAATTFWVNCCDRRRRCQQRCRFNGERS